MNSLVTGYYNLKNTRLLLFIIIVNLIIVWLSKSLLINDMVIYNTYSEQLTYDRSIELFENFKQLAWLSYAFSPIILILKFTIISIVLFTGIFFFNLNEKVSFSTVFKIVLSSEIVVIFASLIKFCWFYFGAGNYDLNDLNFFYPLSLINLFEKSEVEKIWIFPLQVVNVFQIVYIISLAKGLKNMGRISDSDSEKIVLSSYFPALIIWVAFIMFITLDIV